MVKAGALVFIIFVPVPYAIQFQLLGGILMIQAVPAVMIGLYTRALNGWALLLGWAMGTGLGCWMAFSLRPEKPDLSADAVRHDDTRLCRALFPIANMVVSAVLSVVFNLVASDRHKDVTVAEDYA